jgi:hypothetical protein
MSIINFETIARRVVQDFKSQYEGEKYQRFVDYQLYVAILKNGQILTSTEVEVFSNPNIDDCLIILTFSQLAISNWYNWYKIKHVDSKGNVHEGYEKDGWSISIDKWDTYRNQKLYLNKNHCDVYMISIGANNNPWEVPIQHLWEFIQVANKCNSTKEIQLLGENFKLKEDIEELKDKNIGLELTNKILNKEKELYKSLLDDIKNAIRR